MKEKEYMAPSKFASWSFFYFALGFGVTTVLVFMAPDNVTLWIGRIFMVFLLFCLFCTVIILVGAEMEIRKDADRSCGRIHYDVIPTDARGLCGHRDCRLSPVCIHRSKGDFDGR